MILFWHTYVLSYIGLGLISLLIIIQYTKFCGEPILEEDDAGLFSLACALLWPVFLCAMIYSFYKSHLSYVMIVSFKDMPHAWKAAVINERNRNSNGDTGHTEASISTIQSALIDSLKADIVELKQINAETSRELVTVKGSIPGSGQQRSMKRLANIVRT